MKSIVHLNLVEALVFFTREEFTRAERPSKFRDAIATLKVSFSNETTVFTCLRISINSCVLVLKAAAKALAFGFKLEIVR